MNSPLGGFTVIGGIIVIILLLAFIRNRVVTLLLGVLVVGYMLIHVKQIIPMLFNPDISNRVLKGV